MKRMKIGGGFMHLLEGVALACILPLLLLRCTMSPTAGGSTDTETGGVVIALVLDTNAVAVSGVSVRLLPLDYNPVEDSALPSSFTTITDASGTFNLSVDKNGVYNIYMTNTASGMRSLWRNVSLVNGDTIRDTSVLDGPGSIMLLLPDTVDTVLGYMYVQGTPIAVPLAGNITAMSCYYGLNFDSIPSGLLPPLMYDLLNQPVGEVLISKTLTVSTGDTVAFAKTSTALKPLWRFSLQVAVKNTVVEYYGGIDKVKPLVIGQLTAAMNRFNKPDLLGGVLYFGVDSLYSYSTGITTEGPKPLNGYDYRLLYDTEFSAPHGKIIRYSYVYVWNPDPSQLFNDYMGGLVLKLLGELRGCLDLSWLQIDSSDNPVNGQAYSGVPSIMNDPVKYTTLDSYTNQVLSYNADRVGGERTILKQAFPDIMGMLARSATGLVAKGASVAVFGSKLDTKAIESAPLISGKTDGNGRFLFSTNLFKDVNDVIVYGTLLLQASSGGDTTYSWFTMQDAGSAYFANPDTTLVVEVLF